MTMIAEFPIVQGPVIPTAQRRWWTFECGDFTRQLNEWMRGILPCGVYEGRIEADNHDLLLSVGFKYALPNGMLVEEREPVNFKQLDFPETKADVCEVVNVTLLACYPQSKAAAIDEPVRYLLIMGYLPLAARNKLAPDALGLERSFALMPLGWVTVTSQGWAVETLQPTTLGSNAYDRELVPSTR